MIWRTVTLWLLGLLAVGCSSRGETAPIVRMPAEHPAASPAEPPQGDPQPVRVTVPVGLENAGRIQVQPASEAVVGDDAEVPCEVVPAPDGIAAVSTSVVSRIAAWHVDPGQLVRAGDRLVTLDAREVAELRAQIARGAIDAADFAARVREEDRMLGEGATSARSVREASTGLARARESVAAARRLLAVIGAPEQGPGGTFTLRAPIAGTVTRRVGVLGSLVEPLATPATPALVAQITDLGALRVAAHVPEAVADVAVGAHAVVTLRGHTGTIPATVVWRDPSLAPENRTRLVHLRPDAPAALSPEQSGSARIAREGAARGVVVPGASVYREGTRTFVFVRREPGVYEARPVVIGRGSEAEAEVVSGLAAGEPVVVGGMFLVASAYAQRATESAP